MSFELHYLLASIGVPYSRVFLFASCNQIIVTRVRPVQALQDLRFGLDSQSAFDFNVLQALLVKPVDRPDAKGSILADACQFVTFDVAELHEPDLVLVCLQSCYAVLRDYIR